MSAESIEERVAALESQLALLLNRLPPDDPRPAWQRVAGRFTDDDLMRAIDEAALRFREEDRRKFKGEYDAGQGSVE